MQNAQLAYVASALAQLQKLFLFFMVSGFALVTLLVNSQVSGMEYLLGGFGIVALVGSVWMLVCTYRCASGTGRSGILWVIIVVIFKILGLIALCWLTRNWLTSKGVKVRNLGMSFELPAEELLDDSTGFSRF